eukprot:31512-Pelagococcus_subviridis.AAC.2
MFSSSLRTRTQSDVGVEFKGVRWSSKATRAGIERKVWAERDAGKRPQGSAFTSPTRSYGDQCEIERTLGSVAQNCTSIVSLIPGASSPRFLNFVLKYAVLVSITSMRLLAALTFVTVKRCACTFPSSYPPKCITGGCTANVALPPTAAASSASSRPRLTHGGSVPGSPGAGALATDVIAPARALLRSIRGTRRSERARRRSAPKREPSIETPRASLRAPSDPQGGHREDRSGEAAEAPTALAVGGGISRDGPTRQRLSRIHFLLSSFPSRLARSPFPSLSAAPASRPTNAARWGSNIVSRTRPTSRCSSTRCARAGRSAHPAAASSDIHRASVFASADDRSSSRRSI